MSLGSNKFKRAASDRDLIGIIQNGIAGTAMPPSGYADPEIAAIVAYLRNMTRYDPSGTAVGDAARGREIFFGKGRLRPLSSRRSRRARATRRT